MTIKHLLTAALIVAALVFLASCDDADARRTAPAIPPHIHHTTGEATPPELK